MFQAFDDLSWTAYQPKAPARRGCTDVLVERKAFPITMRICDADCPKGDGLCKIHGDVYGRHSGPHTCNTCQHSWGDGGA